MSGLLGPILRHTNLRAYIAAQRRRWKDFVGYIKLVFAADSDVRIAQALAWFNAGAGGGMSAEEFMKRIPDIPDSLRPQSEEFPLLTLVAGHIRTKDACRMAGIVYSEDEEDGDSLVPCDYRHAAPNDWFWVRAHDGTPNLNRGPDECRAECTKENGRCVGTDAVGIAMIMHHGLPGHIVDLPGSLFKGDSGRCAYMWPFAQLLKIRGDNLQHARCGSAVFIR